MIHNYTNMDKNIEQLIFAISNMRNDKKYGIKLHDFKKMNLSQKQALAKLAIEQIINIRNFLRIIKIENHNIEY